jgi:hypothetical protein
MLSAGVVEAFDVIEDIGPGFVAGAVNLTGRPVFSDEKKLSIADLAMVSRTGGATMARSQTLPARLVMPLSDRSR